MGARSRTSKRHRHASARLLALAMLPLATSAYAQSPATPAPAATAQEGAHEGAHAGAGKVFEIDLPVKVNGSYVGNVRARTTTDGVVSFDSKRLSDLLSQFISTEAKNNLEASLPRAGGFVPLEAVRSGAFAIEYDPTQLEVNVRLKADQQREQMVNFGPELSVEPDKAYQPGNFSVGTGLYLQQAYTYQGPSGTEGRSPLQVTARSFANLGGFGGTYLAAEGKYVEGRGFRRDSTTLFHDDWSSAIRYSAGDVTTQSFSFAFPVTMGGISVERLYDQIQPFTNVRPGGSSSLLLQRPSTVDIEVNGVIVRTVRLDAGRYDLRNFAFLDGLNDVRLIVQDDAGTREVKQFSFFSDPNLLNAGISNFSFSVGAPETDDGDKIHYSSSPIGTGFYQFGLTDSLTVGGFAQAGQSAGVLGLQSAIATRLGVLGAEVAVRQEKGRAQEQAGTLNYNWRQTGEDSSSSYQEVDVQLQALSPRFQSLPYTDINQYSYTADARYRRLLPFDIYGSFGIGYSEGRMLTSSESRYSMSFTRFLGLASVSASFDSRQRVHGEDDNRVLLSFSIPLGTYDTARARYDSSRHRSEVEYEHRLVTGVDQFGARMNVARDDLANEVSGQFDYTGNRFGAEVRHDYLNGRDASSATQQVTTVNLSSGFGYTDGHFAIGRPADQGFAIVAAHPTLSDSKIRVRDRFTTTDAAYTDALGAALVPVERAYLPDTYDFNVDDLPPGYDLGSGRVEIFPGARSGYAYVVGSAASNTVLGLLVDAMNRPIKLVSGSLVPEGKEKGEPIPFFTNRTGRFAATKVPPGSYAVHIDGFPSGALKVVVPEDSKGLVKVGTLKVEQ